MSRAPLCSAADLGLGPVGDDLVTLQVSGVDAVSIYGSLGRTAARLRQLADAIDVLDPSDAAWLAEWQPKHATLVRAGDLAPGDRVSPDTDAHAAPPMQTSARWVTVVSTAPMSRRQPVLTVELDAPYRRLRIWGTDRLVWALRPAVATSGDATTEAAA